MAKVRRTALRYWDLPKKARKTTKRQLPADGVDPAVRALLDIARNGLLPWSAFTPAVRRWLYYPPTDEGPPIGVVRGNLNAVGLDLAVVLLADDEAP